MYEVNSSHSRILPLEGLRGLGAILVFCVHFHSLLGSVLYEGTWLFRPSALLGLIGNAGVDLFFLLSGLLTYGMLMTRSEGIGRFLYRRVKRIYPTFLIVLSLYLFLSACCPTENKIHGPVFSKLIYVGENILLLPGVFSIPPIMTVAWALSYEFLFYLLLPIVVFGLRLKSWSANQRCLFCLAILAGYLLLPLLGCPVPLRFAMFLAGMLLSEVSSRPDIGSRLSREGEVFASLLFIASLMMSYSMPKLRVMPGCPPLTGSLKTASLSIGCFALVLFALRFDGFIKTAFSWTPIRWLGNISYSYYLIHGLTLKLIARILHANQWVHSGILLSLTLLLLSFVATFTSASILFFVVEKKHSPRWRHRAGGKLGYACAGSANSTCE